MNKAPSPTEYALSGKRCAEHSDQYVIGVGEPFSKSVCDLCRLQLDDLTKQHEAYARQLRDRLLRDQDLAVEKERQAAQDRLREAAERCTQHHTVYSVGSCSQQWLYSAGVWSISSAASLSNPSD